MSKIKVYELAKELGIPSKELISFLQGKDIDIKNHLNSLEEHDAAMARSHFVKEKITSDVHQERNREQRPEQHPEQHRKQNPEHVSDPGKEKKEPSVPPKKKNIVQVFRPQNTQKMGRAFRRPDGRNKTQMPGSHQGKPMRVNNGRPSKEPIRITPARRWDEMPESRIPASSVSKKETAHEKMENVLVEKKNVPMKETGEKIKTDTRKKDFSRQETQVASREDGHKARGGQERPDHQGMDASRRREGEKKPPYRNDRPRQERDRTEGSSYGQERKDYRESRENRDNRDNRSGRDSRDSRDNRSFNRDTKPSRDHREGYRRNETNKKSSAMADSVAEVQKQQRNKSKAKDDHRKKEDFRSDERSDWGKKGKNDKNDSKQAMQKPQTKESRQEEKIKSIVIGERLTIKELADKMKVVPSVIVKKLFLQGKIVTVNQEIDYETAEEIALEFEVLCEKEEVVDIIEELLKEEEEDTAKMTKRAPVVCVMGHVDHGKTSLLDAIRKTNVIQSEAGGITQHIGASVVEVNGEKITFLDTPGHEAFTAMRMRGASSTDIAILVVAADDGVMPQTVEAINHAKAANIEIVVAVNKIDKPGANVDRVKQELTEHELIAEDWGGSTIFVPISAKTGEGLDNLMEMLLLTAEVMELKANPDRNARGLVLEAELDKGRGPVATVLVQKGTLKVGDAIAAGSSYGRVRAMMNDRGRRVKEAGPSTPVEILGLNDVPNAGEVFVSCDNDKEARSFAETFISQNKAKLIDDTKSKLSLDALFTQIQEGNLKELNIVIKADVQGSVEAIKQSLLKLSNDEVVVKVIHGGVGAVNESDVVLASASNAIIIGFNVRPDSSAKETADREGVDIRLYKVIYNAIEDVEAAMKGMLDPVYEEKILGHGEVRQLFKASGIGTIAGSYVLDGIFERNCQVRITRDDSLVFEGNLASLKRFKDDVKEVRSGYECGLVFAGFNDVREGDKVEAYKMVEVPR